MTSEHDTTMLTLPAALSMREAYEPAMALTEQAGADEYFAALVERRIRVTGCAHAQAQAIERENLGYYAGYYDSETRARVERLFACQHPFFGPIAINGPPTVETALNIGKAIGRAARGMVKRP